MFSIGSKEALSVLQQCVSTFAKVSETIELRIRARQGSANNALQIRSMNSSQSAEMNASFPSKVLLDFENGKVVVSAKALDIALQTILAETILLLRVSTNTNYGGAEELTVKLEAGNGETRSFYIPLFAASGTGISRTAYNFDAVCDIEVIREALNSCLPSCEELDIKFKQNEVELHAFRSERRGEDTVGVMANLRQRSKRVDASGELGSSSSRRNARPGGREPASKADTRIQMATRLFNEVNVPSEWHAAMRLRELQLLLQLLDSLQKGLMLKIALQQPGEVARFGTVHPTLGCCVECAFITRQCGNSVARAEYQESNRQFQANRQASEASFSSRGSSFSDFRHRSLRSSRSASAGNVMDSMQSIQSIHTSLPSAGRQFTDHPTEIMSSRGNSIAMGEQNHEQESLERRPVSPEVEVSFADFISAREIEASQVERPPGLFD